MGWIAGIFSAFHHLRGLRLDATRGFWEVEGTTDFPALLRAVFEWFPDDSVLYFEGGSPNEELSAFMAAHAVPETVHIATGTIWPKPKVFHVPATRENIDLLADLAERCAEPELAVHVHVYRDGEVLLEWHDAFAQPMLLAGSLGENTVREFAAALGATVEERIPRNQASQPTGHASLSASRGEGLATRHHGSQVSTRARSVALVLLGAAALVLKGQYSGPGLDLVHGYGGNVAASFAVYFLARLVTIRSSHPRAWAAGLALGAVELFEVLDGFGVMSNVYDRWDLAANAAGIGLAAALDAVIERISRGTSDRQPRQFSPL